MSFADTDDLSVMYGKQAEGQTRVNGAQEMEEWLRSMELNGDKKKPIQIEPIDMGMKQDKGRPLPANPEPRKPTEDPLGRTDGEEGTPGKIMRNVGEIIPQAVSGIDDAARNLQPFLGPLNNLADWFNQHVYDTTYDKLPEPRTGTGQVTRKVSEFMTGFLPAMRVLKAAGIANAGVQAVSAGAIADFTVRDPHEGRLFDLWNEFGLPKNVLTDFMNSKGGDETEVEARFKNALEGVGLGIMFEGVFLAARALRAARQVKGVPEAEEAFLKAKYGDVPDAEFKRVVGDPGRSGVEIRIRKPSEAGQKFVHADEATPDLAPRAVIRGGRGNLPDFDVYINFAHIDAPEKVKFTIGKMAEAMKGHIDEARRGVVTQKETEELAEGLGMTVPELLARRKGAAFNAEEALASRQLWVASGEQLLELAKKAAATNAGPLDQFAFRRQMAVHAAIQAEVLGARAEAGRALASWKIDASGGIERARAINQVMNALGGAENSAEMARRIAILAEVGDPAALARIAQRGHAAATVDAFREIWVNGLLSSPKTHMVNITSNTLVAAQQVYERMAAGAIRSFTGGEGVVAGEGMAMAHGMIEGYKDAFRMAAKSLKTGETGLAFNKIDTPRVGAVSAESFRISKETGLGRFVDFLGTVTNIPGRLLGAEDEFFKTIGYRMNVRAEALRTATSEGHVGEKLASRYKELVDNPSEAIRINAADAALYQTFTNETGAFGRAIMNLREAGGDKNWMNPAFLILPFVRTPVNIARYAFERSPFAPLVSQWRADIAAGGARADIALARMSTGTGIMLVAMDLADKGVCTGDGPRGEDKEIREALQRQGWQPFSCKVGDRWYSYNRTDPFGMTMGFAASIAEAVKKGEMDQDDVDEWWEVSAMAIAAVSQVSISKTYLEGFAKFVEVLGDPKRYSKQYIQDLFASFLPATSLNNAVKNMVDPVQREVENPMEAVQARIAGLSKNLPPRRDLWGAPITSESGLGKMYDFMSPVQSKEEIDSPIDREIVRHGAGPNKIGKRTPFDGVQANMRFYPNAYDDYTRLSGNDLKHPAWGMGAKDYLNAVVSGNHPMSQVYNMMSDTSQKDFIQTTISDYRKLAQQKVLGDPKHAGFAREIDRLKEIHRNSKMPVLGDK